MSAGSTGMAPSFRMVVVRWPRTRRLRTRILREGRWVLAEKRVVERSARSGLAEVELMSEMEYVDPEAVELPLHVRARSEVWLPAFVVAVVLWVLSVMIMLKLPPGLFEEPTAMLMLYRYLTMLGFVPLSLYVVYTWMAWRRPRHLTVDEEGVRTHSWSVRWDEVDSVWLNPTGGGAPDKKTQVGFMVHKKAWTPELRRGNRWDSGEPFELGGLLPKDGTIQTQFGMEPPIESLMPLFEHLRAKAHGEPSRWHGPVGPA